MSYTKFNMLKRFLHQMQINFVPTLLMLIFSSIIALYISEVIDRAKLRSNDLKPAQASHTRPVNAQMHAYANKSFTNK